MEERKKVTRTPKGLRDILFDEMEALINGESTPEMARAKSTLVKTIIDTKEFELEYSNYNTL